MGAYKSKPVTEKESRDEEYDFMKCGTSCMQGWRTDQEDAHNAILDYDKEASFFGVYDGHGGHEVAEFVSLHYPDHLLNHEAYKEGDYVKALQASFLEFDARLLQIEVLNTLKKMASRNKAGEELGAQEVTTDEEEEAEEIAQLKKEAGMPIDQVLASTYASGPGPVSTGVFLHPGDGEEEEETNSEENGATICVKRKKINHCYPSSSSSSIRDSDTLSKGNILNVKSDSIDVEPVNVNGESNKSTESIKDSNSIVKSLTNGKNDSDDYDQKVSNRTTGDSVDKSDTSGTVVPVEAKPVIEAPVTVVEPLPVATEAALVTESPVATEAAEVLKSNGDAALVPATNGDVRTTAVEAVDVPRPAYTGKGKSGGKGGKVKGRSAITTTTTTTTTNTATTAATKKDATKKDTTATEGAEQRVPRARDGEDSKQVLSTEDLDSSEDEDDATFAIDGDDAESSSDDGYLGVDDSLECNEDEEDEEEEEEEDDEEEAEDEMDPEDAEIYNKFYLKSMRNQPGFGSGCTACVALLQQRRLYVANVGDSRCVVSRAGVAVEMSIDHKPEDEAEYTRIKLAGGMVSSDGRVNGGLNLSRALGDHDYKQNEKLPPEEQMISAMPDVKELVLTTDDDFFIIACDGIWNSLSSQEAVDFVVYRLQRTEPPALSVVCEEMFDFCLAPDSIGGDGTGCDNMTCIIVSFKDKTGFEAGQATRRTSSEKTKSGAATGPKQPEQSETQLRPQQENLTTNDQTDTSTKTGQKETVGVKQTIDVEKTRSIEHTDLLKSKVKTDEVKINEIAKESESFESDGIKESTGSEERPTKRARLEGDKSEVVAR